MPEREVFQSLPYGVLVLDQSGTVRRINRAGLALLELTEPSVLGRSLEPILVAIVDPPTSREIARAAIEGASGHRIVRGRQDLVRLRHYRIDIEADPEGGMVVIAELPQALQPAPASELEARVNLAEQRLAWLVESIDDMFYLIDPVSGQMSYVSPAYERLWGRTRGSMYTDASLALSAVHPDDRERISNQIPIQDSQSNFDCEYRVIRPDGSVRWLHDRGFVIRDESGQIRHYVGVATDITERKQIYEASLQAQRLDSVGRLTGQLAHDFNNILGAINVMAANARHLCDQNLMPRQDLQSISEAAERGADIIKSLLMIAREKELSPEDCDLAAVIGENQTLLQTVLGRHVELSVSHPPGETVLHVDRSALVRVLVNVAANARDAMPQGGRFTISTSRARLTGVDLVSKRLSLAAGDYVRIELSDTGQGMARDVVERAFDPFFTTKPEGFGSGLGLAVVYSFAKQSQGAVEIQSKPGEGTAVRLYVPARFATPQRPPAAEVARARRVLLVDDDALIRRSISKYLSRHGYSVSEAENAEAALAAAGAERFDILITDWKMPGMSGIDLAGRLGEAQPGLGIIIMSGYTGDLKRYNTAWRVIEKSAMIGQIVPAIEECLARASAG